MKRVNDDECEYYSYKFIVFCKGNSLSILNGRLDGSSKVTCKNVSTVDYFLCSTNVLPFVTNLYVHGFCDLLSDVHCAVSLLLDIFA